MSQKDRRPPGAKSKYDPMVDALAELKRLEKAQAKAEAKPMLGPSEASPSLDEIKKYMRMYGVSSPDELVGQATNIAFDPARGRSYTVTEELKQDLKAAQERETPPSAARPEIWPTTSYTQQIKIASNLCRQWNLGLPAPRYIGGTNRRENWVKIIDTKVVGPSRTMAILPVEPGTWPDQPNYVAPSQLKDLEPTMAISPFSTDKFISSDELIYRTDSRPRSGYRELTPGLIYEIISRLGGFLTPQDAERLANDPSRFIDFLSQRPITARSNQSVAADQELISKLRAKLTEQDEALTALTEPAQTFGIVTANCGDTVEVLTERGATLLANPAGLALAEGMYVTLSGATGQILGKHRPGPMTLQGEIVTFVEYEAPSLRCICKRQGGDLLLVPINSRAGLQPGDRLQLDIFNRSVVWCLPKPAQAPLPTFKAVSWSEVGGNVQAKAELREAISLLRSNSELAQAYGLRLPRGILFYGPPGCGKTLLGRAAATELSDGKPGAFVYIKGPEILSKFVGDAESTVRQLFQSAKDYFAETGQRQLLFIDEAEAILGRRGTGLSSDMEKTIVPTFLTEMDGLSETAALVILATNRPDALDPAIIRDGRVDRRICVERPNFDSGQEILRINLAKGPLAPDQDLADLVVLATELIYIGEPSLHQHLSGAFLEGFVERARRHAYRQDLATGQLSGIAACHLHSALADLKKEYF